MMGKLVSRSFGHLMLGYFQGRPPFLFTCRTKSLIRMYLRYTHLALCKKYSNICHLRETQLLTPPPYSQDDNHNKETIKLTDLQPFPFIAESTVWGL